MRVYEDYIYTIGTTSGVQRAEDPIEAATLAVESFLTGNFKGKLPAFVSIEEFKSPKREMIVYMPMILANLGKHSHSVKLSQLIKNSI